MHLDRAVEHDLAGDDDLIVLTGTVAWRGAAEGEGRDVVRSQVEPIDALLARHLRLTRFARLWLGRVFGEDRARGVDIHPSGRIDYSCRDDATSLENR